MSSAAQTRAGKIKRKVKGHGKTAKLREFLVRQDPAWLADELLRIADTDPLVSARLQAAAGADRAGLVDLSGLRRQLDVAIRPGGYVEYAAAFGYARDIEKALDQVDQLLAEGFPEAAIEASVYALGLLDEAFGEVDDSGGELREVSMRAQRIHLAACRQARLDPVALGRFLARWALRSDWEIFLGAASDYAEVLGPDGLAEFESVVDEQFLQLPRLAPGDERGASPWPRRFRPTYLKESLAALRGADDVVEVIAHDLSSPYQFLRSAQVLAADDRIDDALDWLSRGQAAFGKADGRLADLAADLHHRAGRHEQATQLAWQRFTASPSLATYQRLQEFAAAAGDWQRRRAAALEVLRAKPVTGAPGPAGPQPSWAAEPPGHTTLVEVLLWEEDVEAAWQAAQHGGCTRRCWLDLARARAKERPVDAIPILQREVLFAIAGGNRKAYHAGAKLAGELRGYAERAGRSADFAVWIRRIRTDNPRRSALQDELNMARLP
jgi:hypothetical protein